MPTLFLASASPRRAALLKSVGLEFVRFPVDVDETPPPGTPPEIVTALARRKCEAARDRLADGVVLAADTLVFLDGRILGKPGDEAEARAMLSALSAREHEVWSGVAVARAPDGAARVEAARTAVTFREVSPEEVEAYVATGEPLDKAGAYAVQGGASAFVRRIDGSVSNVVGLPMSTALRMLQAEGVDPSPTG